MVEVRGEEEATEDKNRGLFEEEKQVKGCNCFVV